MLKLKIARSEFVVPAVVLLITTACGQNAHVTRPDPIQAAPDAELQVTPVTPSKDFSLNSNEPAPEGPESMKPNVQPNVITPPTEVKNGSDIIDEPIVRPSSKIVQSHSHPKSCHSCELVEHNPCGAPKVECGVRRLMRTFKTYRKPRVCGCHHDFANVKPSEYVFSIDLPPMDQLVAIERIELRLNGVTAPSPVRVDLSSYLGGSPEAVKNFLYANSGPSNAPIVRDLVWSAKDPQFSADLESAKLVIITQEDACKTRSGSQNGDEQ